MINKCDNKSVGMLVWRNNKLLLIERKNFPFGFAPPAGHVDGDSSFEISAKRELKEEVGLKAKKLTLVIEKKKENICRREGGLWHYWKIYNIEADGEINRSKDETKQAGWYDKEVLQYLVKRTEKYLKKEITEEEWEADPGLEVVWKEWLEELEII
jgi:ADP-ribose pyrophosphatase YjhB (NUDIX family)